MLYLYVGFTIVCACLERLFPFRQPRASASVVLNDLLYAGLRLLLGPVRILVYAATGSTMARLAADEGWSGPAQGWPYWQQLIAAFLLLDLAHWVQHWVFHKVPLLWPIHAVHHGIRTMYWGATFRAHFLWMATNGVVYGVPAAIFGFGEAVLIPYFSLHFVVAMSQHSNIGLSAGWLNRVFALWEVHRWHHTDDPRYFGKNYGSVFSFWDALFGTYFNPRRAPGSFGIPEIPEFPQRFAAAQIAPFRYGRLLRAGADGRPDGSV